MIFIVVICDFCLILERKSNQSEIKLGRKSPLKWKLLNVQKHKKTNCFYMILMVWMFDCLDEKSSASCQQSESQSDMYGRWIFDWVLVSFRVILGPRIEQKSDQKGSRKAMRKRMQAEQPKKRSWEALTRCDRSFFWPGKGVGGRVNPSQKGW